VARVDVTPDMMMRWPGKVVYVTYPATARNIKFWMLMNAFSSAWSLYKSRRENDQVLAPYEYVGHGVGCLEFSHLCDLSTPHAHELLFIRGDADVARLTEDLQHYWRMALFNVSLEIPRPVLSSNNFGKKKYRPGSFQVVELDRLALHHVLITVLGPIPDS
jgi:hypothetical protein